MRKRLRYLLLLLASLSWLDVFAYFGKFQELTKTPLKLYVVTILIFSFFFVYFSKEKNQNRKDSTFKYSSLFLLVFLTTTTTIESVTRQGFIFQALHIRPESLLYPALALSGVLLTGINFKVANKKLEQSLKWLIYVVLFYYLARQAPIVAVQAVSNTRNIIRNPQASYEEKMHLHWGEFYDYMTFIKDNTPEDSTIIVPEQNKIWPLFGNASLVRYFLYPRKIGKLDKSKIEKQPNTYIMIIGNNWKKNGKSYTAWPGKEMIFKDFIYYKYQDAYNLHKNQDYKDKLDQKYNFEFNPQDPEWLEIRGIATVGGN